MSMTEEEQIAVLENVPFRTRIKAVTRTDRAVYLTQGSQGLWVAWDGDEWESDDIVGHFASWEIVDNG